MLTRDILNSHSVSTLKKEVSKYNKSKLVSGYSKMKKGEIVELMMKHQDKFKHIKMNEKAPRKKAEPKKKEEPKKKAEPKKKEEPFFKKQLKENKKEKAKTQKELKKKLNEKPSKKLLDVEQFIKKKPSIKELVKYLIKLNESIFGKSKNPLILTTLDELDKEKVISYMKKKGLKKLMEEYEEGDDIEQEEIELKLLKKK